jgi:superfamily I DNA and/or RNA helicase
VVAASNTAVDNLAAGLVKEGVRVVRLGNPAAVKPELREFTLQAQVGCHASVHACACVRVCDTMVIPV